MFSETDILQSLMKWRTRISAAAWVVVHDAHASEDIFQNVALKAMTREVSFETESALLSWAFITARREGIDWLRRHRRETTGLDADILEMLDHEWQSAPAQPAGAKIEAPRTCLEAAPEPSRRLLKLRYLDGYNCEEVAEQMGIGLNAIYKRVSRLHESLRECIEGKLAGAGEAPSTGASRSRTSHNANCCCATLKVGCRLGSARRSWSGCARTRRRGRSCANSRSRR